MKLQKKRGSSIFRLPLIGLLVALGVGILFQTHVPTIKTVLAARDSLQMGWFTLEETPKPPQKPASNSTAPKPVSNSTSANPVASSPQSSSTPLMGSIACNHDNGIPAMGKDNPFADTTCKCPEYVVTCKNRKCQGMTCNTWSFDPCEYISGEDGVFCIAKPIIYLYPEKSTTLDVKVQFQEGYIYVSDPTYDTKFGGWDDVLAYPDGTLSYQGQKYTELYYETATQHVAPPPNGITVPASILEEKLLDITAKFGLKGKEQDEFMEYWLPQLHKLNSPYLLVSLIEKHEKDRIDDVDIIPRPDTFIELLFYFKPLEYPSALDPLILPQKPPERLGFTAVEWGGTIDFN